MFKLSSAVVTMGMLAIANICCAELRYAVPESGDLVGKNRSIKMQTQEPLIDLAVRYELGYNLLKSANPEVDPWLPPPQSELLLPLQTILPNVPRQGIVINVAEMRLYHYRQGKAGKLPEVTIYAISVGRGEWNTPITTTKVTARVVDPDWFPPASIRAEHAARGDILPARVPAGPNNPLGRHLLALGIPTYFIHGTNKKFGIGMQVTHGCIRMYPRNIEALLSEVPVNTPVTIINERFKAGWKGQELFLEVHPPLEGDRLGTSAMTHAVKVLIQATQESPETQIDWRKVEAVSEAATGLPMFVGYLTAAGVEPSQN